MATVSLTFPAPRQGNWSAPTSDNPASGLQPAPTPPLAAALLALLAGFAAPKLLWRMPFPAPPAVDVPAASRPATVRTGPALAPNAALHHSEQLFRGIEWPGGDSSVGCNASRGKLTRLPLLVGAPPALPVGC